MFDIPRRIEHLEAANPGMCQTRWEEISPTRDVSGDSFSRGKITFKVNPAGIQWWDPKRSYISMDVTFSQVREDNGELLPILSSSDLSPNMGLASHCFQSVELGCGGTIVERVENHLAQIDALKTRTTKSKAWLDSMGASTNYWQHGHNVRKQNCAINGFMSNTSARTIYGPAVDPESFGFQSTVHKVKYTAATQSLTFSSAGGAPLDVRHNQVLRYGDLISLQGKTFEVLHVEDGTHVLVRLVSGNQEDVGEDTLARHGLSIHPISLSPSNCVVPKSTTQIVWQPPLGFFDVEHGIPPGGSWTLEFSPREGREWKKELIESLLGNLTPSSRSGPGSVAGNFDVTIDRMVLYAHMTNGDRFDNKSWFLDIVNTKCQEATLPTMCTGLAQRNFDVPGNTHALTMAFQDQLTGQDTRYSASKFKIRPSPKAPSGQELLLKRFYINYNSQIQPSPDFQGGYTYDPSSQQPQKQALARRYVDNILTQRIDENAGTETLADFLSRGAYHTFRYDKDMDQRPTSVAVHTQFSDAFGDGEQHRLLLFSQWRSAWQIPHANGKVDATKIKNMDHL